MDFKKHAYIVETICGLQEFNSWCGKTHVQKTIFLIQRLTSVRLPFQFVLYKHGPYSFELESEIEEMESYDAIVVESIGGYGVTIGLARNADYIRQKAQLDDEEKSEIRRICHLTAPKGVADLERIATAVWVRYKEGIVDRELVASRIHELKPHISIGSASEADDLAALWMKS